MLGIARKRPLGTEVNISCVCWVRLGQNPCLVFLHQWTLLPCSLCGCVWTAWSDYPSLFLPFLCGNMLMLSLLLLQARVLLPYLISSPYAWS